MITIGTVYNMGGYDASLPNNNISHHIEADLFEDGWYVTELDVTRKATPDEIQLILAIKEAQA